MGECGFFRLQTTILSRPWSEKCAFDLRQMSICFGEFSFLLGQMSICFGEFKFLLGQMRVFLDEFSFEVGHM